MNVAARMVARMNETAALAVNHHKAGDPAKD
jgi:hypothetical protein